MRDENIYTNTQGEVILFICKLCDDFEKYITNVHRYKWNTAQASRAFNGWMHNKLKENKGWHRNAVTHVGALAVVDYYESGEIRRRLCLSFDLIFAEQEDTCNIHPIYTYTEHPTQIFQQ